MAKSLADLKKSSSSLLSKIKDQKSSSSYSSSESEKDIWTPQYDKERGSGYARIRFMPAPAGEDFPFVTMYGRAFKGTSGKWYIENDLSTLKQKDPVGDLASRLWNSGIESDKDEARKIGRKTNFYANILIVDDPIRPELNGKVMKFKYGKMIQKIVDAAMFPEFDSDEPVNPFDPWSGADFEIRITTKKMNGVIVPNYEKSFFHKPSALFGGDDEKIEEVWKQCHSLQALIAEDQFKSYDQLKNKLYEVLGPVVGSGVETVPGFDAAPTTASVTKPSTATRKPAATAPAASMDSDELPWEEPKVEAKPAAVTKAPVNGDADDDLSFFENL